MFYLAKYKICFSLQSDFPRPFTRLRPDECPQGARNAVNKRIKSGKKLNGVGHALRWDADAEYRYGCIASGIPRRLLVEINDATGRSTGRWEALEREYIIQVPEGQVEDPNETAPGFKIF